MREDQLASLASALLAIRLDRRSHPLPEISGGEQVWSLVLILFVADSQGKRLSGADTIAREGGSRESGRRYIQYLTSKGLIVGDGTGNLNDVLSMTPAGLDAVETWLRNARDLLFYARDGPILGIARAE